MTVPGMAAMVMTTTAGTAMSKNNKKKYNAKRQKMAQARLVADLAVDLEQIVLTVAQKQGKDGNLPMYVIQSIADWWVKTTLKDDPSRHHLRVAARNAFMRVIKANADVMAKAERQKQSIFKKKEPKLIKAKV